MREVMRLAGEPVHLVGHSYGAFLCLRAAAEEPERVRSAVLYEPVAFGVLDARDEPEARADLDRLGDALFRPELDGTEAWLRGFVEFWNGAGAWDAMPASARRRFGAAAHKTFHEVDGIRRDLTPASAYASIRAPVLLLRGSDTITVERRTCEVLAEALPDARLEVVEGAGHMGPLTHGVEVVAHALAHLRAVEERGRVR